MQTTAQKVVSNGSVLKVVGGWFYGVVDGFRFEARVYAAPLENGLGQGRVAKLFVERNLPGCRPVFDFDRAGLAVDNAPAGLIAKILTTLEMVPA